MKNYGCKCIHPIWSLMKTKVYAMPMLCLWSKQSEQNLNGSIQEKIQRKTPTFDERQPLVIQHWIWIACFVDELSLQLDNGIYHHMVFSLKSRAFRDVFLEAGLKSLSAMQFKPSSNIFHDFPYDIPVIFLRSLSPVQTLPLTVRDSPWVNARNGEHQAEIHDHLLKQMEPMMLRMKQHFSCISSWNEKNTCATCCDEAIIMSQRYALSFRPIVLTTFFIVFLDTVATWALHSS